MDGGKLDRSLQFDVDHQSIKARWGWRDHEFDAKGPDQHESGFCMVMGIALSQFIRAHNDTVPEIPTSAFRAVLS